RERKPGSDHGLRGVDDRRRRPDRRVARPLRPGRVCAAGRGWRERVTKQFEARAMLAGDSARKLAIVQIPHYTGLAKWARGAHFFRGKTGWHRVTTRRGS